MISGFGYKNGKTIWIDTDESPFVVFSSDFPKGFQIPENWGVIKDLIKDGEAVKVKTSKGIFDLNE